MAIRAMEVEDFHNKTLLLWVCFMMDKSVIVEYNENRNFQGEQRGIERNH